jgi:integrase
VTLAEARKRYLAQLDVRANTRTYYERNLNRLKGGKLSDITMQEINRTLAGLGPTSFSQGLASLRAFFKWCTRPPQNYLPRSPLEGVKVNGHKGRSRVLNEAELKTVWEAALRQGYPHGTICHLLILTGQRRGEIANLRWAWIDRKARTITLPDWLTKNGKEHTFPYGDTVEEMLENVPHSNRTDLLFPCRISDDRPISGWSKLKQELKDGVTGWRLHDLRRTYRTNQARMGTPPHIGERLINHVSAVTTDVEQIYDVWTYLPEMRAAVEKYEQHILGLVRSDQKDQKAAA